MINKIKKMLWNTEIDQEIKNNLNFYSKDKLQELYDILILENREYRSLEKELERKNQEIEEVFTKTYEEEKIK